MQMSCLSPVAVGTSQMDASHMACQDTADCSHRVWNTPEGYHSLKTDYFAIVLTFYTSALYYTHTHTHTIWCWPLLWRVSTGRVHAALTVRRSHVVLTPRRTHAPLHPHDMVRSGGANNRTSLTTSSVNIYIIKILHEALGLMLEKFPRNNDILQVNRPCSGDLRAYLLS